MPEGEDKVLLISDTHTHMTEDGESVAPGNPFECSEALATSKVTGGRARYFKASDAPVQASGPALVPDLGDGGDGGDGGGAGGTESAEERDAAIQVAMLELDGDNKELWTAGGYPTVDALVAVLGHPVSGDDRTRLWDALEDDD